MGPLNRARWGEELAAWGYIAGWKIIAKLPVAVSAPLFRWGADIASDRGRGMEQLRANLARVVGPENVTQQLVRDAVRSYMRYWLEAFRLPTMMGKKSVRDELYARLLASVQGLEHLEASQAAGRGVILALPHTGNWDMAGAFLVGHSGTFTTVAERLRPQRLFDAFVDFRHTLGFNVIALTGGQEPPYPQLVDALRRGGTVALLSERDLTRTGVTVDFFGESANMAAGPARLACETGAALHVVHAWFSDNGWGFSIGKPLEVTTVAATTQRMADGFAKNITKHPRDWHMLQPLWNADIERRQQDRRPPRDWGGQA